MLSFCFLKKCYARKYLIPFGLVRLGGCWRNDYAVDDTALETSNLEHDDSLVAASSIYFSRLPQRQFIKYHNCCCYELWKDCVMYPYRG